MTGVQLTFVFDRQHAKTPTSVGPEDYKRFVDEVAIRAGHPVEFRESPLREAVPEAGFILFAGTPPAVALATCQSDVQREIAGRMVPLDVSRPKIFERVLEPLVLAGAIDGMSMLEWEIAAPQRVGAQGLYGRRELMSEIGASCLLFESENYCYLQSAKHFGLPHLLVDYLACLQRRRNTAITTSPG